MRSNAVFLSHIHDEGKVALALQEFLIRALRVKTHIFLSSDRGQLRAGEVWLDRIRSELTDARIALLLVSPRSINSPWINFEAGAAWLAGKVLIPVCFADLRIPSLPRPYSDFQAVELVDLDAAHHLVNAIGNHLDLIWTHLPPPRTKGPQGDHIHFQDAADRLMDVLATFR